MLNRIIVKWYGLKALLLNRIIIKSSLIEPLSKDNHYITELLTRIPVK